MGDDSTPERADVQPGEKVAGYRVEEQIGQGGMAVVYRAVDERLDRRVALKVLAPGLAADNAFRTRFIRESRAAASVDHPNILPVYDAGDAGGCLFISMRYVQGGDVRSLLADRAALPAPRAWNIISQVASALDAAHAHNLIHRDVKPANMLIDRSSKDTAKGTDSGGQSREHVYLSDFGISKQTVASHLTSTGQFVGTLDYIAPEQIEGRGLDGRADQYSLACAAYELLSGAPPFTRANGFALINSHLSEQPPPITTLRHELPQALDRVLAKAMDKSPQRRYVTCEQFAADLGRALGLVPGPLEAGAGQPAALDETVSPAKPPYQATELAGPAAAAAAAAGAAAQVAGTPQETPVTPVTPAAATASPGAMPTDAGAPAGPDLQTMTAGQQGAASGPQQAAPGQQWPSGQQWQGGQQYPPGQQYPSGQQYQPGQQWQGGQQYPSGQQWQAAPGQPGPYGPQYPQQTYPQPGGPSGPGWQQYPQQPPKRSRGLLIGGLVAAAAVIAAGAVVAVTLLNKQGPSPNGNNNAGSNSASISPSISPSTTPTTPVATARQQATAIANILVASMQTRQQLLAGNGLVNDVGNCVSPAYDVGQARQIRDQRQSELASAQALQTDQLANGPALKSELIRALRYSLSFDENLYQWARQQRSSGCTVGTSSQYYPPLQAGSTLNNDATAAKSIFLNNWNPVATSFGLATYSPTNPPI